MAGPIGPLGILLAPLQPGEAVGRRSTKAPVANADNILHDGRIGYDSPAGRGQK